MSKANEELKKIMNEYRDTYRVMCDASRDRLMKSAAPGSKVPESGKLYGEDMTAEFSARCQDYRSRVRAITGARAADLKRKLTEAPSSEALGAVTLLSMRKDVTREEIEDLLERYGDNPQAYKTITSIAKDHEMHGFYPHPAETELRAVEDLEHSMTKIFSAYEAERGRASDGYLSLIGMSIDSAFPPEE